MTDFCDTFWGSHGCDLPLDHDPEEEHPIHECASPEYDEDGNVIDRGLCTQAQYLTRDSIRIRFSTDDGWDEWSDWPLGLFGLDDREHVR